MKLSERYFCRHFTPPKIFTPGISEALKSGLWTLSKPYGACDSRVPLIKGSEPGSDIACVGPYDPHCPHPTDANPNLIPTWAIQNPPPTSST